MIGVGVADSIGAAVTAARGFGGAQTLERRVPGGGIALVVAEPVIAEGAFGGGGAVRGGGKGLRGNAGRGFGERLDKLA
jgi:hypothetical protein